MRICMLIFSQIRQFYMRASGIHRDLFQSVYNQCIGTPKNCTQKTRAMRIPVIANGFHLEMKSSSWRKCCKIHVTFWAMRLPSLREWSGKQMKVGLLLWYSIALALQPTWGKSHLSVYLCMQIGTAAHVEESLDQVEKCSGSRFQCGELLAVPPWRDVANPLDSSNVVEGERRRKNVSYKT